MVGPSERLGKAPHGRYKRKAKLGPTPTTALSLHTTQTQNVHAGYIQLPSPSLSVPSRLTQVRQNTSRTCTACVHCPPNSYQRKQTWAAASKCSASLSFSHSHLCSIPCRRKSLVCVFAMFLHFDYAVLSFFSSCRYVEGLCNCCCFLAWNHILEVNLGEEFTLRFLNWRQDLVTLFFSAKCKTFVAGKQK